MDLELIAVPYDSGRRGYRMGRGPEHLLAEGLESTLEAAGHAVATHIIESNEEGAEAVAFDLADRIAERVRAAEAHAALPIILAGNCISTLGGLKGLQRDVALVWLDAHADLNTPETSPSGFLDGMALSVITGNAYQDRIGNFQPLPEDHVIMLGVRSVDEGEKEALKRVRVVRSSRELWLALGAIKAPDLYLHIDLDSLGPSLVVANSYATPRGLSQHTLHDVIETARLNKRIAALAITAYDPEADTDNNAIGIVAEIIIRVLGS